MTSNARYPAAAWFVLITFAATALSYTRLPDLMPLHWDSHGQPDGYFPKWWAAWIVPILTAIVTATLVWVLSPKRTTTIIINAVAGLMCYFSGVSLFAAMHPTDPPFTYVFMGLGIFLIVVGNILGKLTWNYFVGIRTYWTMDDPRVWERTHRVAGPVYVLGGIAVFCAGIAHASTTIMLALLLATCLCPIGYSYIVWRRGSLPQ
ncbi:MAG: SdpI family protein [Proteobacteria bacterium]|nr:SdpI family protein [Pseudomonadota bacterium]